MPQHRFDQCKAAVMVSGAGKDFRVKLRKCAVPSREGAEASGRLTQLSIDNGHQRKGNNIEVI